MPCDYKKYHPEWKTKIRPDILKREGNCCKVCKVENGAAIFRGYIFTGNGKIEIYQKPDGSIFDAETGRKIFDGSVYASIEPLSGNPNQRAIKVVLTIAHLDQNKDNNNYDNLAALCQKHHMKNARDSRTKKKGLQSLFANP